MPQQTFSFVVRVWKEEDASGSAVEWRGWVDNVLSGERSYIRDLDNISQVIQSELGLARPLTSEDEKSEGRTKRA